MERLEVERLEGSDGTRLICIPEARASLEEWLDRAGTLFDAAAADPRAEPLEGRGVVHVVPRPSGERWVVRHYRRGGAVAALLGDRYLRVERSRPERELEASRALKQAGIATPTVVAAACYPRGAFYRGDIVTRFLPGSRDLAAILFPQSIGDSDGAGSEGGGTGGAGGSAGPGSIAPATALEAAGRLIRRAQEAGLRHPDLNLKNILVVETAEGVTAHVVDLDRARVKAPVGGWWRRRMVRRFWRSARKFERRTGRELGPEARAAFDRGYREGLSR